LKTSAQVGLYCSDPIVPNGTSENSVFLYDKSELYLSLLEDNEYNLVFSLSSGNHHLERQLSFGSFTKLENVLVLNDDIFGFVIQMEFENDSCLKTVEGLSVMKGKNFVYYGVTTIPTYRDDAAKAFLFEDLENTNSTPLDFPTGKYKSGKISSYELDLYQKGRYNYNINGFLISCGKWKRVGQRLLFYDDEMPLPFFAPLDEEAKNVFLALGNPRLDPLSMIDVSCRNGYYSCQREAPFELHLHNGYYVLNFVRDSLGILTYDKISCGGYVTDSVFLFLHDSLWGYEMKMKMVSNTEIMFLGEKFYDLGYKSFYWSKPSKSYLERH